MGLTTLECLAGKTILWTAPTFDQANIAWREFEKAAGGVADFKRNRMEAEWPNGGLTIFRSLDNPDNARGHTADGIVIDEAPHVQEVAYYEVLRPIVSDTDGWMLPMGTPHGRNWFWRESLLAKEHPQDSLALQVPTLGVRITKDGRLVRRRHPLENPDFPWDEIARIWRGTPQRVFEQEYLAQFVEDAGSVFRNLEACATATLQPGPTSGHRYVMGIDWGKANDFTVLSVIDTTTMQQVALDRFNIISYEFQAGRVLSTYQRYQPWLIVAERVGVGEPMIDRMQGMGLPVAPFVTTNQSKQFVIEALALAFEQTYLSILDKTASEHAATQLAELQSFEVERLPGGSIRYQAPKGLHDDCVLALAFAFQAACIVPPEPQKLLFG